MYPPEELRSMPEASANLISSLDEMISKRERLIECQKLYVNWVDPKIYEDDFCLPAMDTYYD